MCIDFPEARGRLVACVCNWNNAVGYRKMDNRLFAVDSPGLYQCDVEDEKGWLFQVILVTFSCLSVLGRSPLCICEVREGTPYLSITYLAHFSTLFQHFPSFIVVTLIKLPNSLPRAISFEDIQILLETISNVRDRALILLLLRTGMRIGELLNVKVNDISFPERKILIYLGEKNYQGRAVYYSKDADLAIQRWMVRRNKGSAYLFTGQRGNQLSYGAAWSAMNTALRRAGLSNKGYSLHSLRHTFATDMLNAGMGLEVLQQLLGHQEIEMTIRYTRIADRTREHEYFKAMDTIEHGRHHEPHRINDQLQKVFEEKKLIRSHGKKLSK